MSSRIYSYEVSVLRDGLSMDIPLVKYGQKFIYVKCFGLYILNVFVAKWIDLPGKLSQIDGGLTKTVYGTDSNQNVYRVKSKLHPIPDVHLTHASVGQGGIWGVNAQGQILFSHSKTGWLIVPGSLIQVDSGPAGVVYGVNKLHKIYYRDGIRPGKIFTIANRKQSLEIRLKCISPLPS